MSLVISCDTGNLSLDDIFRLVSAVDINGNFYIRVYNDGSSGLNNLVDCDMGDISILDILRGALVTNADGEYALNIHSIASAASENGYCATYQTIYDSFATPPSDDIADMQNTLVETLVNNNIWAKLDIFYLFAQTNQIDALINWINPGTYNASLINAPSFTALEGFTGNGSNAYINCNWIPSVNGINYTLNNASFGIYNRINLSENTVIIGSGNGAVIEALQFWPRHTAGGIYLRVNSDSNNYVANTDATGMYIGLRSAANSVELYRNNIRIINAATVSTALSTKNVYVLAYNSNGIASYLSNFQASCAFAGAYLTSGEVTIFTNAIETYMDSNGKGVIT